METKQIIFNSFPRSANVYLGSVSAQVFLVMYATVHIPEIFSVKEINNVTVFRKPEDCISSLINKQTEGSDLSKESIKSIALIESRQYKKYMEYAKASHEHIYIAKFDEITKDTLAHCVNINKIFNTPLSENYEERFKSIDRSEKIWTDKYDGHYPREKDDIRKNIEDLVKSLDFIKEMNEEYEEFILKYKTAMV